MKAGFLALALAAVATAPVAGFCGRQRI